MCKRQGESGAGLFPTSPRCWTGRLLSVVLSACQPTCASMLATPRFISTISNIISGRSFQRPAPYGSLIWGSSPHGYPWLFLFFKRSSQVAGLVLTSSAPRVIRCIRPARYRRSTEENASWIRCTRKCEHTLHPDMRNNTIPRVFSINRNSSKL
jgi:hypothetical protein